MFKSESVGEQGRPGTWGRGDAPSIHVLIELLHLFAGLLLKRFRATSVHCDIGLCENTCW